MAINLNDTYPTGTNAPTPAYPFGSAKNESSPGSLNGMPWERQVINDWAALFQGLLTRAGVTPNGSPDNVDSNAQYLDALFSLFAAVTPTERVELGDNFDAGQYLVCARQGDTVTVTSDNGGSGANELGALGHASGTQALSAETVPVGFRPTTAVSWTAWTDVVSGVSCRVEIRPDGDVFVEYDNMEGSSAAPNLTNTQRGFSVSYNIVANARP